MKPGLGSSLASREVSLSPINGRAQGGFLSPLAKRPLQGGRIPPGASGEPLRQQGGGGSSSKSYVQTELSFKPKALSSPEKPAAAHMLPDASCELCGFYFENRKALASHARAHLRQFGVTEWCVNGSPIETLSAWMRSKPHKVAEVHRTFMQGGGPYPKKEDWIRHLQQHILEMNFPKSVPPLEESSPPAESTDTAAQVL
ncbi:UNVERIFIED_CONTAM: hypothetical protein FKN15_066576 [Acipenser sinensis]